LTLAVVFVAVYAGFTWCNARKTEEENDNADKEIFAQTQQINSLYVDYISIFNINGNPV
jgi:hypothetical protein